MTAQLVITARSAKDALTVPANAVFKNEEGAEFVLVAGSDNRAAAKTVKIGIRGKDRVQVIEGIGAADKIIISGGYALPDKTQIKIEAPPPPEKEKASSPGSSSSAQDKE
jgi:multidrug efflux pump subunit AcrA (membrane-fusion protein)